MSKPEQLSHLTRRAEYAVHAAWRHSGIAFDWLKPGQATTKGLSHQRTCAAAKIGFLGECSR